MRGNIRPCSSDVVKRYEQKEKIANSIIFFVSS